MRASLSASAGRKPPAYAAIANDNRQWRTSCRLAEDTKRLLRIQSMTARVSGCSVPLGRTTPAGPRSKGSGKSRFRSAPRAFPRTPAANLVHRNASTASTSDLEKGAAQALGCAKRRMAAPCPSVLLWWPPDRCAGTTSTVKCQHDRECCVKASTPCRFTNVEAFAAIVLRNTHTCEYKRTGIPVGVHGGQQVQVHVGHNTPGTCVAPVVRAQPLRERHQQLPARVQAPHLCAKGTDRV